MLKQKSNISLKCVLESVIGCYYCRINEDDIMINTTKIVYTLIISKLHHVVINIPYETKNDNKIICQINVFLNLSENDISKMQLIDFFSESKGTLNYKIESMYYSTIGMYNYFDFEINYDNLKSIDKQQRLCYACDNPNQLHYMLGIIDEDNYYNVDLDFDEEA